MTLKRLMGEAITREREIDKHEWDMCKNEAHPPNMGHSNQKFGFEYTIIA